MSLGGNMRTAVQSLVGGMRDYEFDSEQDVQPLEGLEQNDMILLKENQSGARTRPV